MVTPGGFTMSAALSSCGELGWTTDPSGYRYTALDPRSGHPWPAMPETLRQLAAHAAADAGFSDFVPDACLINRYVPGAKMSLHQDKNERCYTAPVVSVSLGLPAIFLFGGHARSDKPQKSRCSMAMWWCGAGSIVCASTESCRSRTARIRSWARNAST